MSQTNEKEMLLDILIEAKKAELKNLEEQRQALLSDEKPIEKTGETAETQPKVESVKTYSFQEVRGIFARISGMGKRAEIKELLTRYGANKLSDLNPDSYEAIVKDAQELANE